jgi:hypothetical protein
MRAGSEKNAMELKLEILFQKLSHKRIIVAANRNGL